MRASLTRSEAEEVLGDGMHLFVAARRYWTVEGMRHEVVAACEIDLPEMEIAARAGRVGRPAETPRLSEELDGLQVPIHLLLRFPEASMIVWLDDAPLDWLALARGFVRLYFPPVGSDAIWYGTGLMRNAGTPITLSGGRISLGKKPGRNERCPCESGLKWKRCHGK